MSIGIIGAGALGSNLARAFAKAGVPAVISNRRGPESLAELVRELGPTIKAGTTQEAARADIVFVALRWVDLRKVLSELPKWNSRVVVDCTNPVEWIDPNSADAKDPNNPLAAYGIKAVDLKGRHSSSLVRELVPGARLVKAFNHLDVKGSAGAGSVWRATRALLFGRRRRRQSRGARIDGEGRLFSDRSRRAGRRRAAGVGALRPAGRGELRQDLGAATAFASAGAMAGTRRRTR